MNTSLVAIHDDHHGQAQPVNRYTRPLPSPADLSQALPVGPELRARIARERDAVRAILHGDDNRLLVIAGPCSLHDRYAALDYGYRLAALAERLGDRLLLVMRAYVEKPRTTVGWKGLLHDPYLDGSHDVAAGLRMSRRLLIDLAGIGLPVATELLSPMSATYLQDMLSWAAIGARTTESQTHREMVSGLDVPVGFKNGTAGDLASACDAMRCASAAHSHLGMDACGQPALIRTTGNPDTHLVLRGGHTGPNCDSASVAAARASLAQAGLNTRVMVDCSHANSGRNPLRQPAVIDDLIAQRRRDRDSIAGVMLESNINGGKQPLQASLQYGVSVTDGCLGWAETERALLRLAAV